VELLENMFRSADPHEGKGRDYTVRQLLDDFSRDFASDAERDPALEITVCILVGDAYEGLGEYDQAVAQFRRALELSSLHLGSDHPRTVRALTRLGWTRHLQSDYAEARTLLEKAALVGESALGAGHRDTLRAIEYLGDVDRHQGRYAEAEARGLPCRRCRSGN